jgi:Flp pilus assembly pilin Flp
LQSLLAVNWENLQKERQHPPMRQLSVLLLSDEGQDIAEYAVMVAVILLIVVGTLRIIGSNSNTVFSSVASAIG